MKHYHVYQRSKATGGLVVDSRHMTIHEARYRVALLKEAAKSRNDKAYTYRWQECNCTS